MTVIVDGLEITKPGPIFIVNRTAEEERADVIAWLRLKPHWSDAYDFADCIEAEEHVGAAKEAA